MFVAAASLLAVYQVSNLRGAGVRHLPAVDPTTPFAVSEATAPVSPQPRKGIDPEPLALSRRFVDFGRVAVHYPARQTVFLRNETGGEMRLSDIRIDPPFSIPQRIFALEPGESAALAIVFDPARPGSYEQRLSLRVEAPAKRQIELIVRGRAILSPAEARVTVPAPPDETIRGHREQERARLLAEAAPVEPGRTGDSGAPAAAPEVGPGMAGEGSGEGEKKADADAASEPGDRPEPGGQAGGDDLRAVLPAVVAAFGEALDTAEDINDVPVPIPEGETRPDLPPAGADQEAGGNASGEQDQEGAGEARERDTDDAAEEDEEGEGPGQGRAEDAPAVATFTVAPNSSVLVYSSQGPISLQSFPIRLRADGATFDLDGRMRFPDLALAFGQTVSIEQWQNVHGTVAPDGTVEMNITLRVHDPAGAFVDLPVTLTTGMAVGYSAEGRLMFATGIPRDPVRGDVKLVGITNIPLGANTALDKAPVYLQILGRIVL